MSVLSVYDGRDVASSEVFTGLDDISARLNEIDVRFERWTAGFEFGADASNVDVLNAYHDSIDSLKRFYGFQSEDVISVKADHPERVAMRARFLREHTHSDFEVRFFVEGRGLFFLHPDDRVYAVLCERGDLISVPANVKHWFDMGEYPELKCIRLFTTPEGWVADYTGSEIAESFPRLEQFLGTFA
ncbi:cupin [Candidatus Methylospira mobilis]|uniref:Acireductone dioxygenase n=1 Tax=Candidatus Methylospira mobilis TaxID=1808979 RepID=A0A5Q0BCA7_9GAMM|nr:cupin [Candidatus Methylospira mobilis]QFY41563.1 cupin [Candidatus Methylospira mobilis]WNV05196.1 cupin [Candidatus Methylospira mobilis]